MVLGLGAGGGTGFGAGAGCVGLTPDGVLTRAPGAGADAAPNPLIGSKVIL